MVCIKKHIIGYVADLIYLLIVSVNVTSAEANQKRPERKQERKSQYSLPLTKAMGRSVPGTR